MRRRKELTEFEDQSNQAGWMYADLFLALMVIFLATISFVPVFNNSANNSDKTLSTYTKIYDQTLNMLIDSYDSKNIEDQVLAFLKQSKYPANSRVVYAQIVGGYNPNSEASQLGIQRAVEFSKLLDRGNPSLIKDTAITLSVSTNIKPSQIVLRLTFASTIGVIK